jgi:hypothetical protein
MKRILLLAAALVAISTVGAQAHIGWDLATCIQRYGDESKPLKRGNAGETHYFTAGDMGIKVILRNDKVKSISYRKMSGQTFTAEETDILQKKNQTEILGCEGIEWIQVPNVLNEALICTLARQDKYELQSVLVNKAAISERPAYVLVIRTWDQISVDRDAATQDQLDKMRNL